MTDDLDGLLSPEDLEEIATWDADAYKITVEVPTSKITDAQLDNLFDSIAELVGTWQDRIEGRDWDAMVYGIGPLERKGET